MVTLYCDLGDTRDVSCGLAEPLHFEEGYADVDDEDEADRIVNVHKHIHYAGSPADPNAGEAAESEESESEDEAETCDAIVQSTGEVCGRELPCPYHSD